MTFLFTPRPLRLCSLNCFSLQDIAFVEELPGANTRGATIEEARTNLQEAVELVLEANRVLAEEALDGRAVIREPFVIVSK